MKRSNKPWMTRIIGAGMLCLAGGLANAQGADAQDRYQEEVQRCRSGSSGQALETCLKEAGAARAELRRNRLQSGGASDYERNQLQRCDVFKADAERRSCIERMKQAPTRGSVEGGGVLREYIEIVPGNPANPR